MERFVLASMLLASGGIAGCVGADCSDLGDSGALTKRDRGIEADLSAVTRIEVDANYDVAVGSGGTVAVFYDYEGPTTVGVDVELRAVTGHDASLWVVGDAGFVAVSHDRGDHWETVDIGTTADLYAAELFDGQVVVAGDEVVRVLQSDVWLEPPPPAGGWGRLRGMRVGDLDPELEDEPQAPLWAVGLDGVIVSTVDPAGAWTVEDSGVSADLYAIGREPWDSTMIAVGAQGTIVERQPEGWMPIATDITADLIDVDGSLAVSVEGDVYERGRSWRLWFSRSGVRAVAADGDGLIAVGESGSVYTKAYVSCD